MSELQVYEQSHYNKGWIAIEGISGTEKAFFANLIEQDFKKQNQKLQVLQTRGPWDSPCGNAIRDTSFDRKINNNLYLADRIQQTYQEVLPFLREDGARVVLQTRHWPSQWVYSAYGDIKMMEEVASFNIERLPQPDTFLFIKDRIERCVERVRKSSEEGGRREYSGLSYINQNHEWAERFQRRFDSFIHLFEKKCLSDQGKVNIVQLDLSDFDDPFSEESIQEIQEQMYFGSPSLAPCFP